MHGLLKNKRQKHFLGQKIILASFLDDSFLMLYFERFYLNKSRDIKKNLFK